MAVSPSTTRVQIADFARRFTSSSKRELAASEALAGHGVAKNSNLRQHRQEKPKNVLAS
jgi:hypothetical protein